MNLVAEIAEMSKGTEAAAAGRWASSDWSCQPSQAPNLCAMFDSAPSGHTPGQRTIRDVFYTSWDLRSEPWEPLTKVWPR
jgi:hypothetical protein